MENSEILAENKSLKNLANLEKEFHFSKAKMKVLPNEIFTKHVGIESHKLQTSLSIY